MFCLGVGARRGAGLLCVTPMFAFFGGVSLRALFLDMRFRALPAPPASDTCLPGGPRFGLLAFGTGSQKLPHHSVR